MIQQQGLMTPSGMIHTDTRNVAIRVTGLLDTADALRYLPIHVGTRSFRLGDIATITQSYEDPQSALMYFNGKPAIGIAVSMAPGGNNLTLGKNLDQALAQIQKNLPLGLEIGQVADQPRVVNDSISEFTESLMEAIIIVLAVSFLSLGVRSGIVVALCIPVVVCCDLLL